MESKVTIPTIPAVFSGKSILITGATGFLGKVLLEKLLRSCPDISEIFILLRAIKKADCDEKQDKLLKSSVFERIKLECPTALNKVRGLRGDVTLENLGLDAGNLQIVLNDVSFVFHCAASVRFQDDPRNTLNINLIGVKNVMDVCHAMTKLEALVHVSTAYSFCNQPIICEEIYPEEVKPISIINTLRWMGDDQLPSLCEKVVKDRPSLYQYSKAMAEIFIAENQDTLPVIIVRPSIITAAVNEPFPGWVDNYNGPSGFIALSGKGLIRTLLVNKKVHADWVPVDLVANTLIAAAHCIAVGRKSDVPAHEPFSSSGVPIVNCVCSEKNHITWSKIVDMCLPLLYKYPIESVYRLPGGTVTSSVVLYNMCRLVNHYLPAFIIDCVVMVFTGEMQMVNGYNRIHGVMNHLQLYTTHRFIFTSSNMCSLVEQMKPEDRNTFPIDQSSLEWPEYIDDYVHGVRKFFLKESDDSLPSARRKISRLRLLWNCGKIATFGVAVVFLLKKINTSNMRTSLTLSYALQALDRLSFRRLQN